MASSPNVLNSFALASRPKTLIAGISPVLIGGALGGITSWFLFFSSFFFSLFIQIGTNFANDYYDHIHGADAHRIGPARATASGWVTPEQMKAAFIVLFAAAFFVSIPLVLACGAWSLCFVLSSILFGIVYTGGPKLGYLGLGDLLVFIYFGPVAIAGTYFVQHQSLPNLWLTLPPALLSVAILTANNLRDADTDRNAGKNTLVVRFGKIFGATEYALCIVLATLIPLAFHHYLPLLLLIPAIPLIRNAYSQQNLPQLLPKTALLLILFTLLFCYENPTL
jgi:1,4-dihydroxy-2-naphthoate octaprenyltransferase